MDGIPVKISEKYKPPRKITIPSSLENRLNAEIKFEEYDFSLERNLVEQMAKLRELRQKNEEESKKKLEMQKVQECTQNLSIQPTPTPVSQNPILTPVPITPRSDSKKEMSIGPINFSDFESDTSSPFDNMELKTINDLEELAHVLGTNQPEKVDKFVQPPNGLTRNPIQWNDPYITGNWLNNSMRSYVVQRVQSPPMVIPQPSSSNSSVPLPAYSSPPQQYSASESVPGILQQLQNQLQERKQSMQPKPNVNSPTTSTGKTIKKCSEPKPSTLPNPMAQLSSPCQNLAHRVAEMGFPIGRCARAAQQFGNDEARVIEFLLQVQKLEDLKIPADRAEKALVANSYSEENTLHYLDSLNQLMTLGFREEQVTQALARFNNDRDKALDFLIS